jgi:hypothetical protein
MTRRDPLEHVPILELGPDRTTIVSFRSFSDVTAKVRAIGYLSQKPEQSRDALELARQLRADVRAVEQLRAAHEWRTTHLRYELEPEQILQSADHALAQHHGDCTAHAIVGAAIARGLGYHTALVTMGGTAEDPEHLSLLIALHREEARATPPAWLPFEPACPVVPGWVWSDSSTPIGKSKPVAFGQAPACPSIPLQLGAPFD